MVTPNRYLSSALELIKVKRFADNWLQESDEIECNDLVALVEALDCLKKDAQQKLSIRRASQASIQIQSRPAGMGGANQGVRRSSRRIASAPQSTSAGSLFVTEHETESESSDEGHDTPAPMLYEEIHDEYTMRNAATEVLSNDPRLVTTQNGSQTQESLLIGQDPSSPMLYTSRLAGDSPDERIDAQPVRVLNEVSNFQAHHASSTAAPDQVFGNPDCIESRRGLEIPPHSLVGQPHDALDSPIYGYEFPEDATVDLPTPQFFNEAFEGWSPYGEVQRDIEGVAAYPEEQDSTSQNGTEDFEDDPTVQSYVNLACSSRFCLPHKPAEDSDYVDARAILSPLVKGRPLTSTLLHGILYTLLRGPILIIDFCSDAFGPEPVEESTCTDFVAIVPRDEDTSPLLVLGLVTSKTLFILDRKTADLSSLGIPWLIPRLETQVQTSEVPVQNLENFELEVLEQALGVKPSEISRGRCLRILQCVNEIGSPHILESLKLACTRKDGNQTYQATEQPIFDKLFRIHIYLDRQESQSHILVARNRYIKYCYFETYLRAVKALQEEKHNSTQERRRVLARKRTASFKQGISQTLPLTPHTEEIHRVYENLSPLERKRRAPDMVKDEILNKIVKACGGNEKRIRRNINKYIKEGRVLHNILHGRRSLDPGLLILFPSFGCDLPSLSMAKFGLELEELEEKALIEAAWFSEVLQARPELLEPVPKTVLDLISNTLTYDLDLQGRDPDSDEMKTEPGSNTSNKDAWPCLGAISINLLNILVFWESSWLSAHEYHALRQDGHQGWLVHARGEDQLLISWEPTIEKKSIQLSPQDLLYEFSVEVRKDRPGLLGYVATKSLRVSPDAGVRRPAFLAYWKVARMTKGLFYYLQQVYSSHRGYIIHEESGKVWVQWEPTWVFDENLNESKKEQLLQISHDPEAILHRFHKAIVHHSMRSVVERRITK
ncbi:hypothetical protein COCMIDRAFT_41275 [Bipolaris oryzae ATCC 44560]|uniref:Uncharacterized protein n=1 Tax=Bipolaris oryzae ATCC 44560 TaxID=930090 RepID=W6Z9K2_COCMI|nr:uncharacterized protein COCMIDRAFT_41275 [Bipolaris oryzae ATCC 44560]EUC40376.1 hypothetical protein COCMIDRAFT_41275 [Bipolaris oryzae ATCC 44560]